MNAKRLSVPVLIALFLVFVVGCATEATREHVKLKSAHLSGKLYEYAPEIDTPNMAVTGGCDCCSGNILFIDGTRFVWADYCESTTSFAKGRYEITNDSLLIFRYDDSTVVKEYNWQRETDTNAMPEYFISRQAPVPASDSMVAFLFHGQIFLKFASRTYYCTVDTTRSPSSLITEMKQEGSWDKLMGQNN